MKNEIEATFLSIDKNQIRDKLKEIGFTLEIPEYLMKRKTFDFPVKNGQKKWARVRQEFNKNTMTIKQINGPKIDDVYEIELIIDDFENAVSFLKECNLEEKSLQENKREVWRLNDVEVVIDTWPGLNPFIEIESSSEEEVKKVSNDLGFDFKDSVFGSIDLIYEKEMGIPSEKIIKLPEITFTNPPQKNTI